MAENETLENNDGLTGETQEGQIDYKALYESEKANAEKWKAMSRKNEEAYKNAATAVEAAEKRVALAEQEASDLRHKQDLADWAEAAARAHNVPASILRGSTADEFMEHAEAIKSSFGVAPVVRDSGEQKKPPKSSKEVFNEFMNTTFNS